MPILEIENLTKDYERGFLRKRKVRALDGLSLSVNQGEIFGFLGANGAGKTTTLKLLMRLIFPTSGSARILGREIAVKMFSHLFGATPVNANISKNGEDATTEFPEAISTLRRCDEARFVQFLDRFSWRIRNDARLW